MKSAKNKADKPRYIIPENVDPVELAHEIKKGMGEEVERLIAKIHGNPSLLKKARQLADRIGSKA